jgi:hypothetical protein
VLVINNPPCSPTLGKASGFVPLGSLCICWNMYVSVMDFVLLLEDRDGDFHKSYQSMLNLKFPVAFLSNLAVLLSLGALYPDD